MYVCSVPQYHHIFQYSGKGQIENSSKTDVKDIHNLYKINKIYISSLSKKQMQIP